MRLTLGTLIDRLEQPRWQYISQYDILLIVEPRMTADKYHALAELRYRIRRFLRDGDSAARAPGLEPQQSLMLRVIRGLPQGGEATIRTLADGAVLKHQHGRTHRSLGEARLCMPKQTTR